MIYPEKIASILTAFYLCASCAMGAESAGGPGLQEREYLKIKSAGSYSEALDSLVSWTRESDDPSQIEINIYRIEELMVAPELRDRCLSAVESLRNHPVIMNTPLLESRLLRVLWTLLLKRGDLSRAEKLVSSRAYLDFYLCGPFNSRGIDSFEKKFGPEEPDREEQYRGKYCPVYWFPVRPDRKGVINVSDMFHDTDESAFYFYRDISVQQGGEYEVLLGKCGYTDLYLDGQKVFESRRSHGFCHDQYRIRVHLESGAHRIVIKTGDSPSGVALSLRITDAAGHPVYPVRLPFGNKTKPAPSRLVETSLYTAMNGHCDDSGQALRKGFFYLMASLSSQEKREALNIFDSIKSDSGYYSAAAYYQGKCESDELAALARYQDSYRADPLNNEAASEIARIELKRGFFHEALAVIDSMKKNGGQGALFFNAMARYCIARGWNAESWQYIKRLENSDRPGMANALAAELSEKEGLLHRAREGVAALRAFDRYDRELLLDSARLSMLTGNAGDAIRILYGGMAMHPSDTGIRVALAEALSGHGPEGSPLSCLSAGLTVSPFSRDILAAMAREYIARGNRDMAVYYLRRAQAIDPENSWIRGHIELVSDEECAYLAYLCRDGIAELRSGARPYENEAAVVLLDESVTWLRTDGSRDRHVRKVIQVNDDSALDDFSIQHVLFSPESERVENLSCSVWENGTERNISERYLNSLSDPDSRLYYDLRALIVPVPSLKKGGVIDLRYTVRQWSGDAQSESFGDMVLLGGRHRIMKFNHTVGVPSTRKLYCHADHAAASALQRSFLKNSTVYRVQRDNIPPYRSEAAMPSAAAFLPRIVFTSFSSWDELFDWYRSLVSGRKIVSEEIKIIVREITAGTDDPAEKARRIYGHVTTAMRYVGFELGIGGIQPRRSDLTYASRMGDCKDMALVLQVMLEEAGLSADLALVRTADRGGFDLSVPYLGYFNHAVCCVHLDSPLFLDATAKKAGFRDLPGDDRDTTAFVIGEEGFSFVKIDGEEYSPGRVLSENTVAIDRGGGAEIRRRLVKEGISAPAMREGLDDKEKKLRSITEYWNRRFPGSSAEGLRVISSNTEMPAEYAYSVTIPSFCEKSDNDLIFTAFLVPTGYFSAYARMNTREQPVMLSGPGKTVILNTYILPEGYSTYYIPADEKFAGADFTARFTYRCGPDRIIVRSEIETRRGIVSPDAYHAFREFSRFIDRKERERIILIRNKETDNATVSGKGG